jgi:hypothetical protein
MIHALLQQLSAKEITMPEFESELTDDAIHLQRVGHGARPFRALTNIVRLLSHEQPDPHAAILNADT